MMTSGRTLSILLGWDNKVDNCQPIGFRLPFAIDQKSDPECHMVEQPRLIAFPSELGWLAFQHCAEQLVQTAIGYASRRALSQRPEFAGLEFERPNAWEADLIERFQCYAAGDAVPFDDLDLLQPTMTSFQSRVTVNCRKIPFGVTVTYGELARYSGAPGAARAVGSVMAKNRFPIVVPCHRVVAANSRLGGFSAPQGIALKRQLLDLECHPQAVPQ